MSLTRLYRKTFRKPLKVYWWRYNYPSQLNFGDELTPYIIQRIFGMDTVWAEPKDCELIGAGSIIEVATQLAGTNPIDVWGSGFIRPDSGAPSSDFRFHAVRGKSSLSRIGDKNVAMGDPGLLASLAFPTINPQKKQYKLGIVVHYADSDSPLLTSVSNMTDTIVINPLWPVEKVLSTIASCELIVSSSLHGLICSDAFAVPNYWLPLSNKLTGGSYKFNDYYSVFDEVAKPIQVKNLQDIDVDKMVNEYASKKNLTAIQSSLSKAFPY